MEFFFKLPLFIENKLKSGRRISGFFEIGRASSELVFVMCDVMWEEPAAVPQYINFPWIIVMCDATLQPSVKSHANHSGHGE